MTVKPIFTHGLDVTELPGIAGWLVSVHFIFILWRMRIIVFFSFYFVLSQSTLFFFIFSHGVSNLYLSRLFFASG
jgi:hypothetical protein